jgi:NADPH-dependent 2,4-dienoyl-CoA reductase/sulfur reductase-like enzyme
MQGKLAAMDNVRIMTRTTVTGVYDGLNFGALERVGQHLPHDPDLPRECFWRIRRKAAVLAAGALERPIAFPMNDRPGIMLASAVRSYLNRYGVAPGRNLTLFATNDDAHRTAVEMQAAGLRVAAVIDSRTGVEKQGDYRLIEGGQVVTPRAATALRQITVRHGGRTEDIETDCLAMSGGWNPSVHLTCHLGARPVWDADAKAFLPAPGRCPA